MSGGVAFIVKNLSRQVRPIHAVAVGQPQSPDAGAGQQLGLKTAEAAAADDQRRARRELLLPGRADFG